MRRALAAAMILTNLAASPAFAQQPEAVAYHPPLDAPVQDGFRPPTQRFGAGNRGLEYSTVPGSAVRAAAAGSVTFAGQVGGARYVTILHADRLRTTYGPLATIEVANGQAVGDGTVIGTTGPLLLWTARLGTAYLDPDLLLAASSPAEPDVAGVRLVPNRRLTSIPGPDRGPVSSSAARWALE